MWLKKIDLYLLQIQLCMPIKHHLAERTHSENLVVKVVTDSGVVGFGEGIARQYVTGEVMEASLRFLQDHLIPELNGFHPSGPPDLIEALAELLSEGQSSSSAGRVLRPGTCHT